VQIALGYPASFNPIVVDRWRPWWGLIMFSTRIKNASEPFNRGTRGRLPRWTDSLFPWACADCALPCFCFTKLKPWKQGEQYLFRSLCLRDAAQTHVTFGVDWPEVGPMSRAFKPEHVQPRKSSGRQLRSKFRYRCYRLKLCEDKAQPI